MVAVIRTTDSVSSDAASTDAAVLHPPRPSLAPRRGVSRRGVLLGGAGVLVAAAVSGCSDTLGAAATVGAVTIPEQTLLDDVASVLPTTAAPTTAASGASGSAAPATADPATRQLVNREVLTFRVRHALLDTVRGTLGVTADETQVGQVLSQGTAGLATQLGLPAALVPDAVRDALTMFALVEKNPTVTNVSVTMGVEQFDDRSAAVSAQARYRAEPSRFTGQARTVSLVGADGPTLSPFGVFAAPDGSVLLAESQGQYAVLKIDQRAEQQSRDLLATLQNGSGQLGQAQTIALAWLAVQPQVQGVRVQVNPRFGAWDPISLQVVPTLSA